MPFRHCLVQLHSFLFTMIGDADDSLAPPPSDADISVSIRIKAVKSVLQQSVCEGEPISIAVFDVKAQYRYRMSFTLPQETLQRQ